MREEYYLKVDECPLRAWKKANEGEYKALRRFPDVGTEEEDAKAFELLYNDYIKEIGLTKEFEEYLDLLAERVEAQLAYIESVNEGNRNRFYLNKIKMLDAEILSYEKTNKKGMSITETLLILSKNQGYHLKETEITVLEYYELLKLSNNGRK